MSSSVIHACGNPHLATPPNDLQRWPGVNVLWSMSPSALFGKYVTPADAINCFTVAWASWAKVCGVRPTYTPDQKAAHVLIGTGTFDGPWGRLAYTEIPDGLNWLQRKSIFDESEAWLYLGPNGPPVDRHRVNLLQSARHELGHALGIGHGPAGCVMCAQYSPSVVELQSWDSAQAVLRYGPAV